MMGKVADPIHIDGLTANEVFDRIAATQVAGADRGELRLLAGRLSEAVTYKDGDQSKQMSTFKPGMRLWGVLVV